MNGMLFHQEALRNDVERRQHEARQWAESRRLGHLASAARTAFVEHERSAWLPMLSGPTAVALLLFALVRG